MIEALARNQHKFGSVWPAITLTQKCGKSSQVCRTVSRLAKDCAACLTKKNVYNFLRHLADHLGRFYFPPSFSVWCSFVVLHFYYVPNLYTFRGVITETAVRSDCGIGYFSPSLLFTTETYFTKCFVYFDWCCKLVLALLCAAERVHGIARGL